MIKPGDKFYIQATYSVKLGVVIAVNEVHEIAVVRIGKWYDWPWIEQAVYTFDDLHRSVRVK